MPGHDVKALELELRSIFTLTEEMLRIIIQKGYTTPREFALVSGAVEAIAAQMKTLVTVSKDILSEAR
jgi:hypothetical protein